MVGSWAIPCPDPGCEYSLVPVIGCHWWVIRSCGWGLLVAAVILIWLYIGEPPVTR